MAGLAGRDELPRSTQFLFRMQGRVAADSVTLRGALRLGEEGSFEMVAFDGFGRRLWTLHFSGEEALWLDHREKEACRLDGRSPLPLELSFPVRLSILPRILLGLSPVDLTGTDTPHASSLFARDELGRPWRLRFGAAGELVAWSLGSPPEPELVWSWDGTEAVLVATQVDTELRWRTVTREPLAEELASATIPQGYSEAPSCRASD